MQIARLTYRDALNHFRARRRRKFIAPKDVSIHQDALDVLCDVGYGELAPDFVIPSGRELRSYNRDVDWPRYHIGTRWSVIAVAGTGDAWLASIARGRCEMAFGDHAKGYTAPPRKLGITPRQWLCLAMIVDAFETEWNGLMKSEAGSGRLRELAAQARNHMDRLSTGLSRRYPFKLYENP